MADSRMPTTICVDLLNFCDDFFKFGEKNSDFEKSLKLGKKRIKAFVHVAKSSGYKLIGFIDKAIATDEALKKWFQRRKIEMQKGHKNSFPSLGLVVGTIFAAHGVDVHYSTIDCDDTIAAFAHQVSKIFLKL